MVTSGSLRVASMLLVALCFALPLAIPSATAATFACTFKASCLPNETALLLAQNDTFGYNNAHAQLVNDTVHGSNYTYPLCCYTDASHTLSNSCSDANATTVLKLNTTENSHVQIPGPTPVYPYSACMALSPGNLSCLYVNTTCAAGYSGIASLAASETNGGQYNMTNAHLAGYLYYNLSVCCKGGNTVPTVPVLNYPTNNNYTVFERNVTFNWTASTDPDGDAITYGFNLTQASCTGYTTSALSPTSYMPSSELCVDKTYNWTVQACDPYGCSAWASVWNFTIASVAGITFLANTTDFGTLQNGVIVNTTNPNATPFRVQNTGNVPLNVTFKAYTALYTTVGLNNDSWQYKSRVDDTGAFDLPTSQMNWTNVSGSYTNLLINLKYPVATSKAYVDIQLRVPAAEGAGTKTSTVEVLGNYT